VLPVTPMKSMKVLKDIVGCIEKVILLEAHCINISAIFLYNQYYFKAMGLELRMILHILII